MATCPNCEPLRERFPDGFERNQIVYRELYGGSDAAPHYTRIDVPRRYDGHLRLKQIVRQILAGSYAQKTEDAEEASPHILDIPVARDSYVVISLADGTPSFEYPGITLTSDNAAYGALRYVDATGMISKDWIPGCRLLYFHARHRRLTHADYKQGFNFHVPQIRTKMADSGIIDPDIRFPGTGGSGLDPDP